MTNKVQVTRGNHKLPRDIVIWDLPHGSTCPGATAECKKYCYAFKAERMYKQVLPYRQVNYKMSLRKDFAELMIAKLKSMRGVRALRLHSSGDLYNQEYLNKWVKVIKAFPEITFTAYTKSLHLDFTEAKKCKNFILFASMDPTTPAFMKAANTIKRKARVVKKGEKVPTGYFECPGSCKSCSHCYTKGARSVAFHQH